MKRTISLLAAAATLTVAGAAHAITAAQAVDIITHNGYVAPTGLQLNSGVWRAQATSQDGVLRSVLVDDATGSLSAIDPTALRNGWGLPGAAQVMQALRNAGWAVIEELDFDNGLWEAEVRRAAGQPKYEVLVHPVTLAILNRGGTSITGSGTATSALTAQQIVAALRNAGYTRITDLEYDRDDGYWEAEARNARGQKVDLYINATTGAVIRETIDRD